MIMSKATTPLTILFILAIATPTMAQNKRAKDSKIWTDAPKAKKADKEPAMTASGLAKLAKKLSPAVVNIIVTIPNKELSALGFVDPRAGRTAVGSGFIINEAGYLLTNNHVVENATRIRVKLNDNRVFEANVIGTDPLTDVALVKIRAKETFTAIPLADSTTIQVGEHVLAIGNPLGLNHTVTSGIVSALGRKNLAPGGRELQSDFIQTDASINPGNSGGPLINLKGEVIGINTAVNRAGQGIGFAIPINIVKKLIPQLLKTGYIIRAWLGVRIQPMTPLLAKSFGLKKAQGALVSEVVKNSPAFKGGMRPGDIVLNFNNTAINDGDQLTLLVSTAGAGQSIPFKILRKGKTKTLKVKLEAIPNQKKPVIPTKAQKIAPPKPDLKNLGLVVKPLTDALARQQGASNRKGVILFAMDKKSPAVKSGLQKRDVILEVGSTAIADVDAFYKALNTIKSGKVVRLRIIRGGRLAYLAFQK